MPACRNSTFITIPLTQCTRLALLKPVCNGVSNPSQTLSGGSLGEREVKRRAPGRLGFDPDSAPMALDNLLADGQPDAGAGIGLARVQALEDLENAFKILRINADAIVPHPEDPAFRLGPGADVDFGRAFAAELEGVGDQILEQLRYLAFVHRQSRQRVAGHSGIGGPDAELEIAQCRVERRSQVRRCERPGLGAEP